MNLDIILRLCNLVVYLDKEGRSRNICLTTIEVKCEWKARLRYHNEKINGNKDVGQPQHGCEPGCVCVCERESD